MIAEAPLTKIGDVQVLFDSIQDYIRDKSTLLATKESLVLQVSKLHTLVSVRSTAYPILLALLSYFHIKDWWTKRTPGKPIVKISLTIERQ
ncbi:hypothetical protein HO999_03580 [Streptococcus suis]|nr:hypothetical protein [Streptococcus suis]NQN71897.1 hypothetical protein [Streptococcus suis]NQN73781.1 hypothetical protein [Streptococcus suis]NQN78144.1 hypothetical protein [Streptococcus suis]